MIRSFGSLALIAALVLPSLATAAHFENLRYDKTVPRHCQTTRLSHFQQPTMQVFTVSTLGAIEAGFTYEYPLYRPHGKLLFDAMQDPDSEYWQHRVRSTPGLWDLFQSLRDHHEERGFHFETEGEVLELLALLRMQHFVDELGANWFVSGSVEYHHPRGHHTLGELDIIIADRETCAVIGYGEVKLGIGRYNKAKRQVNRFFNYLRDRGINTQRLTPPQHWFNGPTEQDLLDWAG